MRSSKLFPFDGHDKPERELEMRILVTGAGGMLGSAFLAHSGGHSLFGVGRAALDPRDRAAVDGLAAAHRAEVLVNCAADTDVEGAEAHPERTFAANAELPGLLAAGCQRAGALMVQISSTGCYGAWKETPYCEDDPLRPTTVYHRTKAAGEAAVTKQATDWLILRVGWLYGGAGSNPKNFVARRLEEAARSREMLADPGQRGNPTFADDVVRQTLLLVERGITGVFNCVAQGDATRADYVRAIVAAANLPCIVRDAPPGHFHRRAPVSRNEAAVNARLAARGLDRMPEWRPALAAYVHALRK
jgi:dTDP-4-dehydrorhamnose reductase